MMPMRLTVYDRLKLKRPQAAKKYRHLIDEMYAEIEAGSTAKAKL